MRRNIKAGIKLFLRNFFDRFRKPRTPGFSSQPESFEGNRLLLLLLLLVLDLNRIILTIAAIYSICKEKFRDIYY